MQAEIMGPSRHRFYCAFTMVCAHDGIGAVIHDSAFKIYLHLQRFRGGHAPVSNQFVSVPFLYHKCSILSSALL